MPGTTTNSPGDLTLDHKLRRDTPREGGWDKAGEVLGDELQGGLEYRFVVMTLEHGWREIPGE